MGKSHIFYDKYAKTKRRLFILFLLLIFVLLGTGIGILKLSNLEKVGMGLETVYEDRVMPLKHLKMLSDIYGINIVDTANKVSNFNITWDKGRKDFEEAVNKIPGLWNEYIITYLIEEEKKLAEELEVLFQGADQQLMKLRKILIDEDYTKLEEFIKNELYQSIDPVTNKIDELFQIQILIVKEINEEEKSRYEFSLGVGTASIIMSIILSIIVVLQWRRFRRLLNAI